MEHVGSCIDAVYFLWLVAIFVCVVLLFFVQGLSEKQ